MDRDRPAKAEVGPNRFLLFLGFALMTGGFAFWALAFLLAFGLVPYGRTDFCAGAFAAGSLFVSAVGAATARVWITVEDREEEW